MRVKQMLMVGVLKCASNLFADINVLVVGSTHVFSERLADDRVARLRYFEKLNSC